MSELLRQLAGERNPNRVAFEHHDSRCLRLPRPLEVLRGKGIAVLGAFSVLVPPLWSLRCWGLPWDFGVFAAREDYPAATWGPSA